MSHYITSCRYCKNSGCLLKNGKLEGSEQRSSMTLHFKRLALAALLRMDQRRERVLRGRLVRGYQQDMMAT